MKLSYYAPPQCFLRRKIEAAAAIAEIPITRKELDQCDASSLVYPRYPALHTPHGIVPGSNAALRYIANASPASELYGTSLTEKALVDSMVDCVTADLENPIYAFVVGAPQEKVVEDIGKALSAAEGYLTRHTFMVGERMTLADLSLSGAAAALLDKKIMTSEALASKYPHLCRLLNTVSGRAKWGIHVDVPAEGSQAPHAAAAQKHQAKGSTPKKEGKQKQSKAPKDSAPKESAPKKTADNDEEAAPPAPKVKDPIEELAPSDFDMDAWKRCYSNTKDLKGVAMPYLWEHYDREGWSFWHFEYIRFGDDDNTKVFMASNLLGMFLQRIDNWLRKYMFGVCNVFEEQGYFGVEGVLLLRGHVMPKRLVEHDQYESFKWTKLDAEKDKQYIEDFFCEGDEINGKKIADCKVYK